MFMGLYYNDSSSELFVNSQMALILQGQSGGSETPHCADLAFAQLVADLLRSTYLPDCV